MYYDGSTDYGSMHFWNYEFWFHMLWPWGFLNWIWLGLGLLYLIIKLNEKINYETIQDIIRRG